MNGVVKILFSTGLLCLPTGIAAQTSSGVPVFKISLEDSSVRFAVKASVAIEGVFDKWEAALTYPSTDAESGVLDINIQADSVNTGSGVKDDKLRSIDFFNGKEDPYITFHSTKIVQTGPTTFDVQGTFTIARRFQARDAVFVMNGKGQVEERSKTQWPLIARKGVRDEQRHSVHKNCGPRRGQRGPKGKTNQWPSAGVQAISQHAMR